MPVVLHDERFKSWLAQDSGPLLVSADPGCGKSVLAKHLIDEALPRSATLCYFFSIILAAERPLRLAEMNVAVNINEDSHFFDQLDLEEEEDFESSLRSWCGLFVSIHHGMIYFLHQTAEHFFWPNRH